MSNVSLNYAQIIDPVSFKSVNMAKIYVGEYGTLPNPAVSGTWKQAYFVNSDGTRAAASQPIRTNAAGFAVDGSGNIKTVQVDGGYSLLVQDQYGATKFSQACSPANDGAVLEFDTISGFIGATDGSVCYFKGRDAVGDGAGGTFRYSASSTATADDGVIFAPAGGGRLLRDIPDGAPVEIDWFLPGDYNPDTTSCKTASENAIAYCLANKKNLHHSEKRYRIIGDFSFPYGRINGMTPTSLTDYGGIKIYGEGMGTVLETDSVGGADVLQLNGADNIEICHLSIRSFVSGTASGSNAISITGGYDRLVIHDIWPTDLAFVDKTTYVDGAKALSIQTPVSGQTVKCGTLKAWNIFAKGCVYGAGVEIDLVAASTMPTSIDIDIVADSCREAVVISAAGASAAIPADWNSGIKVKATAINCMNDVNLSRAHGVDVNCHIVTTKTDAQRILSPTGSKWSSSDTIASVIGLKCVYAHNSEIFVTGNKGACSYKALVGGASAGSSGLFGATINSHITCSISGTSSVEDWGAVDSGGNVTKLCVMIAYGDMGTPNVLHYAPASSNAIAVGNVSMLGSLLVQGQVKFTSTDGKTAYANIDGDDEGVMIQQTGSSSGSARNMRVLNHSGSAVMSVRNDGSLGLLGFGSSGVSAITKAVPVYDPASGAFIGYIPIYGTNTP